MDSSLRICFFLPLQTQMVSVTLRFLILLSLLIFSQWIIWIDSPIFSEKYLLLQTANLDGETNLKIRKALEKTWDYSTPEKASEFKGFAFILIHSSESLYKWTLVYFSVHQMLIEVLSELICCINLMNILYLIAGEVQCEQPNNSLYTFTGNLIIDKQTLPLTPSHILLRVRYLFLISYFYLFVFYTYWNYFYKVILIAFHGWPCLL